jgi:hypothetical protein
MKAERLSMSLVILGLFAAMVSTDRSLSVANVLMGLAVLIGFAPARVRAPQRTAHTRTATDAATDLLFALFNAFKYAVALAIVVAFVFGIFFGSTFVG